MNSLFLQAFWGIYFLIIGGAGLVQDVHNRVALIEFILGALLLILVVQKISLFAI